jgi:hypothetical protein
MVKVKTLVTNAHNMIFSFLFYFIVSIWCLSLPTTIVFYLLYSTHTYFAIDVTNNTIPSLRLAAVLEEEKWKDFRKYLRNQNEKRMFRYLFSFGICITLLLLMLLIQLESILLWYSIVFHHYKTLKEKNLFARDYAVAFGFKIILKI